MCVRVTGHPLHHLLAAPPPSCGYTTLSHVTALSSPLPPTPSCTATRPPLFDRCRTRQRALPVSSPPPLPTPPPLHHFQLWVRVRMIRRRGTIRSASALTARPSSPFGDVRLIARSIADSHRCPASSPSCALLRSLPALLNPHWRHAAFALLVGYHSLCPGQPRVPSRPHTRACSLLPVLPPHALPAEPALLRCIRRLLRLSHLPLSPPPLSLPRSPAAPPPPLALCLFLPHVPAPSHPTRHVSPPPLPLPPRIGLPPSTSLSASPYLRLAHHHPAFPHPPPPLLRRREAV